jgi:hypothetical protein
VTRRLSHLFIGGVDYSIAVLNLLLDVSYFYASIDSAVTGITTGYDALVLSLI